LNPDPERREPATSLSSLASPADHTAARALLGEHLSMPVARRICVECGADWPCPDVLYAWFVLGMRAEG
jgi:hypothetical protein